MKRNPQKTLWISLGISLALIAMWGFFPLSNAVVRIEALPIKGVDFKGENIPLNDFEKEFLKKVSILKRNYLVGNKYYFVTVIDGTYDRHTVHDPYYCFVGSGWTIDNEKSLQTAKGEINTLEIKKGDESRDIMFFFTNGEEVFSSPMKYWMLTTLRRLTLGLSGSEPVLVVVQAPSQYHVDWNKFNDEFPYLIGL